MKAECMKAECMKVECMKAECMKAECMKTECRNKSDLQPPTHKLQPPKKDHVMCS